jgi:SAM-dependent methyltransferase
VEAKSRRGSGHLIGDNEDLPIATESVDVIVMFNCLQLSTEPHRILREIHRVLTPDGHLFIVDANANSLMGWISSLVRRLRPGGSSQTKSVSLGKLEDWLRLLNFQMAPARHKLAVPFAHKSRWGAWFERADHWLAEHNIPIGSYYVLFGNKSVWGYVQEQPSRRVKAKMVGLPVAKPVIGGARGVSSRQSVELVPDK